MKTDRKLSDVIAWPPWGRSLVVGVVLAVVAGSVGIASCDTTPVEPPVGEMDMWEGSSWSALFRVAEAWGGRVEFTFHEERGKLVIDAIDPRPETQSSAEASTADPICSISDEPGIGEAEGFRDCMSNARAKDVCDSEGVFVLEWDDDSKLWHLRCPGER